MNLKVNTALKILFNRSCKGFFIVTFINIKNQIII